MNNAIPKIFPFKANSMGDPNSKDSLLDPMIAMGYFSHILEV